MNLDTEKIIRELSYRVSDGTPNLTNPIHILEMKIIMLESGYPVEFVSKITSILSEDTKESFNAVNKDTEETSIFATEKARDAAIKSGTHKKWVGDDDDDKASDNKEDDGRPKGAALFDTDETEKIDEPDSKTSVDSSKEDNPKSDSNYHTELENEHKDSPVFTKQIKKAEQKLKEGLDIVKSKEISEKIVNTKKNVNTINNMLPGTSRLSLGSRSSETDKTNAVDIIFSDNKQFNFHFEIPPADRSSSIEKLSKDLTGKGWNVTGFNSKKLTAISPEGRKYSIHSKPSRENSKKQMGEATAYEVVVVVALAYGIASSGMDSSEWGGVIDELVENGTYTTPGGDVVDTNDLRADARLWFSNVDNVSKVRSSLDGLLSNKKIATEMAAAKDIMSKMDLPEGSKMKINCEGGLDTDEFRADIVIYAETPAGKRFALIGSSVKDGSSNQLGQLGPRKAVDAINSTKAGSKERAEAIKEGGYENQIQKLPMKMRDKFRESIVDIEDPEQIHQAMLDSLIESAEDTPEVLYDFMVFNIVGTNPPEGLQGFMYQNGNKVRKIPLPGSEEGDKILSNISELFKEGRIRKSKDPKKPSFLMYVDKDGKEHPIMKTRTKKTRDGKIERTYIEKGGTKSVLFKLLEGEVGR